MELNDSEIEQLILKKEQRDCRSFEPTVEDGFLGQTIALYQEKWQSSQNGQLVLGHCEDRFKILKSVTDKLTQSSFLVEGMPPALAITSIYEGLRGIPKIYPYLWTDFLSLQEVWPSSTLLDKAVPCNMDTSFENILRHALILYLLSEMCLTLGASHCSAQELGIPLQSGVIRTTKNGATSFIHILNPEVVALDDYGAGAERCPCLGGMILGGSRLPRRIEVYYSHLGIDQTKRVFLGEEAVSAYFLTEHFQGKNPIQEVTPSVRTYIRDGIKKGSKMRRSLQRWREVSPLQRWMRSHGVPI